MTMLRKGMAGEPVRILQQKLGVSVDGQFGPATDAALRSYQQKNGLLVDGIAGPDTFAHMGLFELVLLRQGSMGDTVKKLQTALGITADGRYGPATERAVREFQSKNGLAADGVAGPLTLSKIDGFKKEMTPQVIASSVIETGKKVVKSVWDTITGMFKKS